MHSTLGVALTLRASVRVCVRVCELQSVNQSNSITRLRADERSMGSLRFALCALCARPIESHRNRWSQWLPLDSERRKPN